MIRAPSTSAVDHHSRASGFSPYICRALSESAYPPGEAPADPPPIVILSEPEAEHATAAEAQKPVVLPPPVRPIWQHVMLATFTLGLYQIYWFYITWRYLKNVHGVRATPVLRAVLGHIFAYSLFRHLFALARERGYPESPPAGPLAVAYVVLLLLGRLPGPASLGALSNVLALLPAFEAANFIWSHDAPEVPPRTGFTLPETMAMSFGAAMIFTTILAYLDPSLAAAR
jgi:hypothetical protein